MISRVSLGQDQGLMTLHCHDRRPGWPYDDVRGVHRQAKGFTSHEVWDFAATSAEQYPLLLHFPHFGWGSVVVRLPIRLTRRHPTFPSACHGAEHLLLLHAGRRMSGCHRTSVQLFQDRSESESRTKLDREVGGRSDAFDRKCTGCEWGLRFIRQQASDRYAAPSRGTCGKDWREQMKLIVAVIKPFKLEKLKDTLKTLGVQGMTLSGQRPMVLSVSEAMPRSI